MKSYGYILLDLDGTLVYSHPGIFACFRYAMEKMGRERPTDRELLPVIGPSLEYSFENFFHMTREDAVKATALYRERYAVKGVWENDPIEGALESVKAWKKAGYKLALATSKPAVYAEKIVEKHGFLEYLDELVGCGLDGSLPTKADVIEEAISRLGAEKNACLMVGDRSYDAEGARIARIDCALLRIGGYATEEELQNCGATYLLDDFAALDRLLKI